MGPTYVQIPVFLHEMCRFVSFHFRMADNETDCLCFKLFFSFTAVRVSGYDGYTTCSKPYRSSKSKNEIPCDFRTQNWCTIPGTAYPW